MARTRTSSDLELLLPLDRESPQPLHRQLEQGLREAIRDGRLPASDGAAVDARARGPARGLARDRRRGVRAAGRRGLPRQPARRRDARGAVGDRGAVHAPDGRARAAAEFDFRPGRPDVSEFPRAVWLRSLRRALLRGAERSADATSAGTGSRSCAIALATYLNRARGTAADPADVVICSGFAQGLGAHRAGRCAARGARRVAVEDPSDPEYRATLARGRPRLGRRSRRRARPARRPAGRRSTSTASSSRPPTSTRPAACCRPTAGRRSPTGRRARGALDRRGRLRRRVPLRPRADRRDPGPAPGPVVYAGSASKVLAPGLRLGWLLSPPTLTGSLIEAQAGGRHGLARARPARVRRRPRARRARPPPAPDAADLPRPARRAAGRARAAPARRPAGRAPPRACTCSRGCPHDVDEAAHRRGRGRGGHRASAGSRRGGSRPGPGGLIFGYGVIARAGDRARDRAGWPGSSRANRGSRA